jgi:carbamate kinase
MRVVVALGGNALLQRGQPMTVEQQRENVAIASEALARVAGSHSLVVTHGNGPQVGLLALQAAAYKEEAAYPLDVLGAATEGMIGYMLEQELGNRLPFEVPLATILTMVEVDPDDPAFNDPTKFVGPIYEQADADRLVASKGWVFKRDGNAWRRVVPSPRPVRIFEHRPIRSLVEQGVVVVCAGGGGIPTSYGPGADRRLYGVEAVVDKDLTSAVLAADLEADVFVMATDIDGVYQGWGTPEQRRIETTTPSALRAQNFAAGSMGPKVLAAIEFVERTGHRAVIGRLDEIDGLVTGTSGTNVVPDPLTATGARTA